MMREAAGTGGDRGLLGFRRRPSAFEVPVASYRACRCRKSFVQASVPARRPNTTPAANPEPPG